ncbi:dsDNA nuclease domain-containing protein [Hymenobacter guriensis]|uniref:DUF4297 domain-containing protein n=1 Tax=Hymenobacter guriensis TaxID=2793065 RepID=A0ABS0L6H2_9BACT|nr:dsDNA nuclease domain-containing protein [Hymenobacter guriensis]MBG8555743.1 DUF4297 domain-containing protein [Hymenobacter guriensis]
MSIKDEVFSILPREKGGSTASNRFDYQKNWAICKILELHAKPDDYLVSFEYHDDIIIFDSSLDPQKISFFQVKTQTEKVTHWKIGDLLKRSKNKAGQLKNSYLGKMYDNIIKYKGQVESLCFVTNAKIKGSLSNNVNCDDVLGFKCGELCDVDLNKILDGLKIEYSLSDLGNFKDIMFFKVGQLSIAKHDQLAKAELADFIEAKFPGKKYQVVTLYKNIFEEVRRKSNVEETITDFQTLKEKKSISRDDFEKYLAMVTSDDKLELTISRVEGRLNAEQIDFDFVRTFKRYAKLYDVERSNHSNQMLKTLIAKSKNIVDKSSCRGATLWVTLDCLFVEAKQNITTASFIDDDYLRTILLFHLYE